MNAINYSAWQNNIFSVNKCHGFLALLNNDKTNCRIGNENSMLFINLCHCGFQTNVIRDNFESPSLYSTLSVRLLCRYDIEKSPKSSRLIRILRNKKRVHFTQLTVPRWSFSLDVIGKTRAQRKLITLKSTSPLLLKYAAMWRIFCPSRSERILVSTA